MTRFDNEKEHVQAKKNDDKPGRRFVVTVYSTWGRRRKYFPWKTSRANALEQARAFSNADQSTQWSYLHNKEKSPNNVAGEDVGVENNSDSEDDGRLYEVSTIREVKVIENKLQGKCYWKPSFQPLSRLIEDCPDLVTSFLVRARKHMKNARVSATDLAQIPKVFEELEKKNVEADQSERAQPPADVAAEEKANEGKDYPDAPDAMMES
eukprot:GHVU01093309.1.p1 GENE.GHVU01093309.1~~GHVU01093309.1.p1  ORF type:complete len:209 (-),score=36.20 GHVU01093309.1:754-1380(-)